MQGGEGNEEDNAERQSQAGRIRASPGRLVKLNNKLSPLQKSHLCQKLFGSGTISCALDGIQISELVCTLVFYIFLYCSFCRIERLCLLHGLY